MKLIQQCQSDVCPVCKQTINRDSRLGYMKIYCSDACGRKAHGRRRKKQKLIEKQIAKKVEQKACAVCGTPISRTGARGPIKKICETCYSIKENARGRAFKLANKRKISDRSKVKYQEKRRAYLDANRQIIENKKASSKEKSREMRAAWIKDNPEKIRLYKERGAPKRRERARAYHAKHSTTLGDSYIKHLLVQGTKISKKSVPQSLVDLKRVQVQITRALKEINK